MRRREAVAAQASSLQYRGMGPFYLEATGVLLLTVESLLLAG